MTLPSDERAFLKAIADNPADETARGVFADWLADRGEDAKARFARLSAEFLRCLRELGEQRPALPPDWAAVVDPLFDSLRLVSVTWEHEDGDTRVTEVCAAPGQFTIAGRIIVVLESDRLCHEMATDEAGVVVAVFVRPGDTVHFGQPLLAYLPLPIRLPLPQARPPLLPLPALIAFLRNRRADLRLLNAERISAESFRYQIAARMVFGSEALNRAISAAQAARLSAGHIAPANANSATQAMDHYDILIEALELLAQEHGQPTGFAELPPPAPAE